MIRMLVLVLLATLTLPALPQNETLAPGDPRVDATRIEPYTARWRQWVTGPDGSQRAGVNTITDRVQIHESEDGRRLLVRDLLWESTDGSRYRRVDVLDRESLAPVRMRTTFAPDSVTHVDFDGLRVAGISLAAPTEAGRLSEGTLERPAFSWSSDGFLLAGLDLDALSVFGLSFARDLMDAPAVGEMTFEVEGIETVETLPFGNHEAHVVRQTDAGGYWGRYWVSERAPYVVQVIFTQQDGTTTRWELF